jgi:saccharopepsin
VLLLTLVWFSLPFTFASTESMSKGTSLIALPVEIANMINEEIGAEKGWNGQYTVDCSKVPSLPDFTFYFGGKPFPISGTEYILEVQGTCISAFSGFDMPPSAGSLWIIGTYLSEYNIDADKRV